MDQRPRSVPRRRALETALGLVAAVVVTTSVEAGMTVLEVGTFRNSGLGTIDYQGEFGMFVSSVAIDGKTRIDLDVSGILGEIEGYALAGVRLIDTGENQYGFGSAGADIDLVSFSGLAETVDLAFSYLGPTGAHQNESSDALATRVAAIDAQSGVHEWAGMFHVSLGNAGMLTAMLSTPQGGTEVTMPPLAGNGLGLHLAEAGLGESYRVQFFLAIPAPAGLLVLALGALGAGRTRRRSA